jgi:hypothetical protein
MPVKIAPAIPFVQAAAVAKPAAAVEAGAEVDVKAA